MKGTIGTNGLEIKVSAEEAERLLARLDSAYMRVLQAIGKSTSGIVGADQEYKQAYMRCVRAGLKEKPKATRWPESTMVSSATWKEGKQPPKKKDGRSAWYRHRKSEAELLANLKKKSGR